MRNQCLNRLEAFLTYLNKKHLLKWSHQVRLESNHLLWFKEANRYLLVSEDLKVLLDLYFKCQSKSMFVSEFSNLKIEYPHTAETYYEDISSLLSKIKDDIKQEIEREHLPSIPLNLFKTYYQFGNIGIAVYYDSQETHQLIHSALSHAIISEKQAAVTDFHIFEKQKQLFLFKNGFCVGHYLKNQYYLLQGRFWLELINTLYSKTEDDWAATLHASTICTQDEAVMLIGESGNGKSTLSAILMAHGFDLLCDDLTPLSAKNLMLYRTPAGISIKEGAFKTMGKLFPEFNEIPSSISPSKNINHRYVAPKNPFGNNNSRGCNKLIYVKYDPAAESSMAAIPTENILEVLISDSWISPLPANAKLFMKWVQQIKCYKLTYSSNAFAVDHIEKLILK